MSENKENWENEFSKRCCCIGIDIPEMQNLKSFISDLLAEKGKRIEELEITIKWQKLAIIERDKQLKSDREKVCCKILNAIDTKTTWNKNPNIDFSEIFKIVQKVRLGG